MQSCSNGVLATTGRNLERLEHYIYGFHREIFIPNSKKVPNYSFFYTMKLVTTYFFKVLILLNKILNISVISGNSHISRSKSY